MKAVQMKRQAGVTLMELMIAVTLLSLLYVGLLFALRIGLTAYSKTRPV
jgi:prepilin-type N-terminal cleavage/methylation domain-containing protein